MSVPRELAQPPRLAAWFIDLLAPGVEAEPIRGDLFEEFSTIASGKGTVPARRWYWKQSLKSTAHLSWASLRSAPWLIAFTTLAGFSILWCTQNQLELPIRLICAAIDRDSSFYMNHFFSWQFCLSYGVPAVGAIFAVFVGCLIAIIARGREIVATAVFGLFELVGTPMLSTLLFLIEYHYLMPSDPSYIRTGLAYIYQFGGLGALMLYFGQPIVTVLMPILGGMFIRSVRMHPEHGNSVASLV